MFVASLAHGQEKAKDLFDGNEVSLTVIKSDPKKYFGKPFFMVGKVEISDYYNWAYSDAQDEFYSLTFDQSLNSTAGTVKRGESCHLYLKKDALGKTIIDAILEQEKDKEPFVRVIAGEGRLERGSPDVAWRMLDLVDIQFFINGKWQDWMGKFHRDKVKEAQIATAEKNKQERNAAETAKAEQLAKLDQAKWRTWTSRDGSKKLEAKFVKSIGDKLTLQKKDGTTIDVSLGKFSDEDASWIKRRGWTK